MAPNKSRHRVVDIAVPALLEDPTFQQDLTAMAERLDISFEAACSEVNASLEELAIVPQDLYLSWSARLARFMYSRSYAAKLDVDTQALRKLKEQAKSRPLVFLWSHKSHLDSFVFLRAIYDGGFTPQPLSFAGANMNFAGFGTLARNAGAIFLRRSFKGAEIYKLVFKYYVRYLVEKRAPLSWSIEGTRSRTGKLMPPKPGLLQWVLDAMRETGSEDALLVPVSISFDQIAEMDDYVAINRGQPKRKESLGWFLGYIFGMQKPAGKIHVRFGEPVGLSDTGAVPDVLIRNSSDPRQAETMRLALEVSRRIEHATLVTPHSLVSLAMLATEESALSEATLAQRIARIFEGVEHRDLPREKSLSTQLQSALPSILHSLSDSGVLEKTADGSWQVDPNNALAASYYRNTISHFFLYPALGELALVELHHQKTMPADARAELQAAVLRWRSLLKFEFVFLGREESCAEALTHLDRAFPDWEKKLQVNESPFGEVTPIYATGILNSPITAYCKAVETIPQLSNRTTAGELSRQCLNRFTDDMIPSSRSLPLLENCLRLLQHEALWNEADGILGDWLVLKRQLQLGQDALSSLQTVGTK